MIVINSTARDGILSYLQGLTPGVSTIEIYGGTQTTPNSFVGMTLLCDYDNPPWTILTYPYTEYKELKVNTTELPVSTFYNAGQATWALVKIAAVESLQVPVTVRNAGVVLSQLTVESGNTPKLMKFGITLGLAL